MHMIFDGIKSQDMGIAVVNRGESVRPILGEVGVERIGSGHRIDALYSKLDRSVIEIHIELLSYDFKTCQPTKWSNKKIREVGRWLIHDDYKELQFGNDIGKRYYAIATGGEGLYAPDDRGVLSIVMTTNSPFAWSPLMTNQYDSDMKNDYIIVDNYSNYQEYVYPTINIKAKESGDVSIRNEHDSNRTLFVKGMREDETITINNDLRIISSDIPMENGFAKVSGDWIALTYGENRIHIDGDCIVDISYQFPLVQ